MNSPAIAVIAMISTAMILYTCQATTSLHPLILIPGNGGNQLEARLTAKYKPTSLWCKWYPIKKDSDGWFRLWFDSSVLLSPLTKCFSERMMLYYDSDLDDYYNAPGVETRVPNFGSTQSLLYLDPNLKHISAYMAPLVESLEQLGYEDGKNMFGAPYDFRYGLAAKGHPSQVGSKFLDDLKNLIETASDSNGGQPVILVSHSLGGLFALQLLDRNPISWRRKYIKHLVALSAPWGGAVDEMLTLASGNTLGVPLVDPLQVREEQRSSESNMWLLPSPAIFGGTKPLVVTPRAEYTAGDISRFLVDIGFSDGVSRYESRVLPLVERVAAPPGVPVTCIFGSGVETAETLVYGEGGFDKQPEIVYGDGDGTVNMVSLTALQWQWGNDTQQEVEVIKIPGVSHMSMVKDNGAIDRIVEEISCINSNITSSTTLISTS
nr:lecithin-cholesterol acyltransferase-like 1 [Ipomoea batatas]GMD96403.1 lecithin-cholesterol acyltransferase-like 1 [Ipomoea batatas]